MASFCGRMLCMKTSARAISCCKASRASACLRSSTTLRLLRLQPRNMAAMPSCADGPVCRVESPCCVSTLITVAP
ncbi:hypothetical protein D3C78_1543530 [compost metagenome]